MAMPNSFDTFVQRTSLRSSFHVPFEIDTGHAMQTVSLYRDVAEGGPHLGCTRCGYQDHVRAGTKSILCTEERLHLLLFVDDALFTLWCFLPMIRTVLAIVSLESRRGTGE